MPPLRLFLPDHGGNRLQEVKSFCWGCPGPCPFCFQGDQRDEEEETQMKKSESEVEVRAGRTAGEASRGLLQPGPAWP